MDAPAASQIHMGCSESGYMSFLLAIDKMNTPHSEHSDLFDVSPEDLGLEPSPPFKDDDNGIVSLPPNLRDAIQVQATVDVELLRESLAAFEASVQHGVAVPEEAAWDSWETLKALKRLCTEEFSERLRLLEVQMVQKALTAPTIQDGRCYVCGERSGAGGSANMLVCDGVVGEYVCNRTACADCVGWQKPRGGWIEAPNFYCNTCARIP